MFKFRGRRLHGASVALLLRLPLRLSLGSWIEPVPCLAGRQLSSPPIRVGLRVMWPLRTNERAGLAPRSSGHVWLRIKSGLATAREANRRWDEPLMLNRSFKLPTVARCCSSNMVKPREAPEKVFHSRNCQYGWGQMPTVAVFWIAHIGCRNSLDRAPAK